MIEKKNGFSLAEVLVALGIISIIATAVFSITKRGIEKAYDYYVYTGYKAISDAFALARNDGTNLIYSSGTNNSANFGNFIKEILNGEDIPQVSSNDVFRFKTNNGISYNMYVVGDSEHTGTIFEIKMQIPSNKWVDNNGNIQTKKTACFRYAESDELIDIIVPYESSLLCESSYGNLATRKDLLPFYLDDGRVGRTIPNGTTVSYEKRKSLSFSEIVPNLYNTGRPEENELINLGINCPYGNPTRNNGAIRLANPRKVF